MSENLVATARQRMISKMNVVLMNTQKVDMHPMLLSFIVTMVFAAAMVFQFGYMIYMFVRLLIEMIIQMLLMPFAVLWYYVDMVRICAWFSGEYLNRLTGRK